MKNLLRLILIVVFFTLFKNTSSHSRPRPSCPSDQPKCCNLDSNKYSKHMRKYDIHPKGHSIKLVNDQCSSDCPIFCPKQLGESCGGYCGGMTEMITDFGYCDSQWLTCKTIYDDGVGVCVRNHKIGIEKTEAIKDAVPVCDDLEKEDKVKYPSRKFS